MLHSEQSVGTEHVSFSSFYVAKLVNYIMFYNLGWQLMKKHKKKKDYSSGFRNFRLQKGNPL